MATENGQHIPDHRRENRNEVPKVPTLGRVMVTPVAVVPLLRWDGQNIEVPRC